TSTAIKSGVNSQTEDSDPLIHSRRLFGPRLARSGQFGGVRRHYAAVAISFLRTMNRFTSAQVANNRLAFFISPRERTFTNPNFSFIPPNTCSTLDRTVDFVRFFARSTSSIWSLYR